MLPPAAVAEGSCGLPCKVGGQHLTQYVHWTSGGFVIGVLVTMPRKRDWDALHRLRVTSSRLRLNKQGSGLGNTCPQWSAAQHVTVLGV